MKLNFKLSEQQGNAIIYVCKNKFALRCTSLNDCETVSRLSLSNPRYT